MIPNITRGGRMAGLMVYLVSENASPERGENVHSEPHLVAGDSSLMAWHDDGQLGRDEALAIAHDLDRPRRAFGTRVTVAVKDSESGERVGEKDAHVWHCSLSLHKDEGLLDDERWAQISEAFVERMGFVDPEAGRPPCRWVALRHGTSAEGNDHVHLVVGLVHEDGRKADVHNDRPRAQRAARELEQRFGLRGLESREVGRGARAHKPAEQAIAERTGRPEAARETLARTVRACAAAAGDEAEFVRRVRRAGVRIKPRYEAGRGDVVSGYSVALRPQAGEATAWYSGGRLARDLTLPRLRAAAGWPDTPQDASAAVGEWQSAKRQQPATEGGRETRDVDPKLWARYTDEVTALREQLRTVPTDDRGRWARVAHDTAGAFAAWSLQVEDEPGPLAETADALARAAQLGARQLRPRTAAAPCARGAAYVLASVAHGGSGTVAQTALLLQLANTIAALRDAHQAAGELRTARQITAVLDGQLRAVAGGLPEPVRAAVDEQALEAARTARQGFAAPREPGSPLPANVEGPAPRPTPAQRPDPDREAQR